MERVHRDIARDVARLTGAALAQVVVLEPGGPRTGAVAVEGAAAGPATRAAIAEVLAADPGVGPAEPLLLPHAPPRVIAPCEPALAALLPAAPGRGPRSVFHLLAGAPDPVLLRVVATGAIGDLALRALDAAARLAAGKLEAERARREGASRSGAYRALQESAGEAILVVDAASGRVLEGNQRLCELCGRRPRDLARLSLDHLLEHPLHAAPGALLAHLRAEPLLHVEDARLRRRRGEPVPVALTAARIQLPGRAVLHVIARDVTRERRALADLRAARDTLAGLHGAGTQLMNETDEAGVFRVVTRELLRLGHHAGVLGPAPEGGPALAWRYTTLAPAVQRAFERILGQPLGALRIDPATTPLVRRCLAEGRPVESDRIRPVVRQLFGEAGLEQLRVMGRLLGLRRAILSPLGRAGTTPGVLVVAAPRHRRGDVEAIDAFAQQASIALEKAHLFAALERERAGLEREVDKRTRELTLAVTALEEAGQRRDHFLANVSHELRTPLVTVLGWADLLVSEKLGPLAPRQRAALEVIATSGRRLRGFIDELLELERHELTRGGLQFSAFEVGDVLTQTVMALAPRYAERGLRLRARVARRTPRAWGDRERIVQALSNLLVNAERYSPDGATVRVAAARVRPGRLEIAVADQGAGIPEEHVPHVFDRLYQVRDDRGAGHRGGALGIGLALVKSIVEAHGGTVAVRSKVGRGTTFTLSLPTVEVLERQGEPLPELEGTR